MTRALCIATDWRPYAYLAFAIGLLLADPVARGVAVCLAHGAAGCPGARDLPTDNQSRASHVGASEGDVM